MKYLLNILKYLSFIIFLPIWCFERIIPRKKNIWIFGSRDAMEYSDNSKYLFEYVSKNYPQIKAIWITKNKEIYKQLRLKQLNVLMFYSIKSFFYSLIANYAFVCILKTELPSRWLNGCKIIWLYHGMPLKKIGRDISQKKSIYSSIKQKILSIIAPYKTPYGADRYITTSSFFIPFLESAWNIEKSKILKVGQPRCDVFFTSLEDNFISNIRKEFPCCRIILYMPTFRINFSSSNKKEPFNPFSADFCFNNEKLYDVLNKTNSVIIYKPHFFDKAIDVSFSQNSRLKYLHYNDVYDTYVLLNSVDALFTDYSSVYFDYICKKKPMALLTFDYESYINNSRGHYFNMYEHMKSPICRDWDDVCRLLQSDSWESPVNEEIMKFAEYNDGNSCKKIVEELLNC